MYCVFVCVCACVLFSIFSILRARFIFFLLFSSSFFKKWNNSWKVLKNNFHSLLSLLQGAQQQDIVTCCPGSILLYEARNNYHVSQQQLCYLQLRRQPHTLKVSCGRNPAYFLKAVIWLVNWIPVPNRSDIMKVGWWVWLHRLGTYEVGHGFDLISVLWIHRQNGLSNICQLFNVCAHCFSKVWWNSKG